MVYEVQKVIYMYQEVVLVDVDHRFSGVGCILPSIGRIAETLIEGRNRWSTNCLYATEITKTKRL